MVLRLTVSLLTKKSITDRIHHDSLLSKNKQFNTKETSDENISHSRGDDHV